MNQNKEQEFIECPTCNGKGEEFHEDSSYDSPSFLTSVCSECYGELEIENPNFNLNKKT